MGGRDVIAGATGSVAVGKVVDEETQLESIEESPGAKIDRVEVAESRAEMSEVGVSG